MCTFCQEQILYGSNVTIYNSFSVFRKNISVLIKQHINDDLSFWSSVNKRMRTSWISYFITLFLSVGSTMAGDKKFDMWKRRMKQHTYRTEFIDEAYALKLWACLRVQIERAVVQLRRSRRYWSLTQVENIKQNRNILNLFGV